MAKLLKHIGLGGKKLTIASGDQQTSGGNVKRENGGNYGAESPHKVRNKADKSRTAKETFVVYCTSPTDKQVIPIQNTDAGLNSDNYNGNNNDGEKNCHGDAKGNPGKVCIESHVIEGVLILPDYSDPLDFRPPVTQCVKEERREHPEADDDYTDPFLYEHQPNEAGPTLSQLNAEEKEVEKEEEERKEEEEEEEEEEAEEDHHSAEEGFTVSVLLPQQDEDTSSADYDDVSHQEEEQVDVVVDNNGVVFQDQQPDPDPRPCEEYDTPWEWRRRLNTHPKDSSQTRTEMMAWQRPFYETAFDSAVQRESDVDELDRLVSHVACRTSPPSATGAAQVKAFISRDNSPGKGHRKVTLVRERDRSLDSCNPPTTPANRVHVVRALVHDAPRSANSTPVLAHRAVSKLANSSPGAASSTRSTPTRTTMAKVHVPVRQFSDLALGSSARSGASPKPVRVAPLPPCGAQLQMNMLPATSTTAVSSLDSLTSTLSSASSGMHTDGSTGAMDEDPRPTGDYDKPWDQTRGSQVSSRYPSSTNSQVQPRNCPLGPGEVLELKRPLSEGSPSAKPSLRLSFGAPSPAPNSDNQPASRSKLTLNFDSQSPKRPRQQLQLNFGCAALSAVGEKIDQTLPLERQGWYHGSISRVDAENLLRVLKEGSYLVRNSESSKRHYSLSLKSARGFMHMRIVDADGKYVLGQFSKPFNSIPEMIHHYSISKLPIKGAEHMSLLHPVIDQLL